MNPEVIYNLASMVGKMSESELSALADALVWQHEGRADHLSSFIGFAIQDKNFVRELEYASAVDY